MTQDARFEDGVPNRPLRLRAEDAEDLAVLSAMVQDAVLPVTEMQFDRSQMRFGMLVNRFRWEDRDTAQKQGRDFERVQSMLVVHSALGVRTSGLDQGDREQVLSLLSLSFEPSDQGAGQVTITLAGDGAIACDVECLDVTIADVTRPYVAPSGQSPAHEVD